MPHWKLGIFEVIMNVHAYRYASEGDETLYGVFNHNGKKLFPKYTCNLESHNETPGFDQIVLFSFEEKNCKKYHALMNGWNIHMGATSCTYYEDFVTITNKSECNISTFLQLDGGS